MVRNTTLALGAAGLALAGAAGYAAYQSRSTPRVPYTRLEMRGAVAMTAPVETDATDELRTALADASGYTAVGEPVLLRYDGPGTPPFLRTNEVALEVRRTTATPSADAEPTE